MSRIKVKLADNIARVVFIEADATVGATLLTDLKLPNGQVATLAQLQDFLGITSSTAVQTGAHRLLSGLTLGDDHPQYTRKDTLTARGDLYARGSVTVQRLALGTDRQFFRAGALDPAWETVSPTLTLGLDLSGNVTFTNLASATLNATIGNDAVTNAKLANMAQSTIKGRAEGAGTGDPTDLTPTQVVSIIDGEAPTWGALHTFTANILLQSANPRLLVQETGLSADTGAWDLNFDAGVFDLRTRTDADGAGANILRVTRPAGSTTPSRVYLGNQVTTDPAGFNTTADNARNYDFVFSTVNNSSGLTRIVATGLGAAAGSTGYNSVRWNTSFSSPTQIQSADVFGTNRFGAYNTDTSSIIDSVVFRGIAKETWSATAAGAAMQIRTIAAGTTALLTTLEIFGNQVMRLDGSAAAPSDSYQNDTDTGWYRIGANNPGLSTGGTLRWDINTARIVTTLPQQGPDGSAGAPTYGFSGVTTKGMYSVGTNQVGLSANSVLQFEVGDSYSDHKTQTRFTGEYRPAQYTANQDNIALPATASVFYFSTDASRNLTGMQGGVAGRMAIIINNGTQPGVLVNDATSTAANRFLLASGSNTTLQAGGCCVVLYDGTASRWRQITRVA